MVRVLLCKSIFKPDFISILTIIIVNNFIKIKLTILDLIVTFKITKLMIRKTYFYTFGLFLLSCLSSLAQNYTITGKVFDAESKEPLPFVAIIIKGTTIGATTDFDGNFSITTSKLGDSLVASYVNNLSNARFNWAC